MEVLCLSHTLQPFPTSNSRLCFPSLKQGLSAQCGAASVSACELAVQLLGRLHYGHIQNNCFSCP
jgi:hypothetical protein